MCVLDPSQAKFDNNFLDNFHLVFFENCNLLFLSVDTSILQSMNKI